MISAGPHLGRKSNKIKIYCHWHFDVWFFFFVFVLLLLLFQLMLSWLDRHEQHETNSRWPTPEQHQQQLQWSNHPAAQPRTTPTSEGQLIVI